MGILELRSTITEIKNPVGGPNSRMVIMVKGQWTWRQINGNYPV